MNLHPFTVEHVSQMCQQNAETMSSLHNIYSWAFIRFNRELYYTSIESCMSTYQCISVLCDFDISFQLITVFQVQLMFVSWYVWLLCRFETVSLPWRPLCSTKESSARSTPMSMRWPATWIDLAHTTKHIFAKYYMLHKMGWRFLPSFSGASYNQKPGDEHENNG